VSAKPRATTDPHTIGIQIDEQFQTRVQPGLLRRAASRALVHQEVEEQCDLTVVVVGDETVHSLNRRHRGVDAPTDVLAFPDETPPGPFVDAPGLPCYLGDIIISFPRAEAQAAELGHDIEVELQLLVVHGVLHLLGHDDVTEEQRARMWNAQAEILQALEVEANLPA